jgi:hypothetical protein
MTDNEFSVCQFFKDGSYEFVRKFVSGEEAVRAFKHYTESVATKLGVVDRVIITDGGDCTNIEWRADKGFTYDGEHWASSPRTEHHPDAEKTAS